MDDAIVRSLLDALAKTPDNTALRLGVIRALHAARNADAARYVDGLDARTMSAADRAFIAGVLLGGGDPGRALVFADGGEPELQLARARALLALGDRTGALAAYETAVAFHADSEFCKSSGERVRAFSAEDLAAMDDEALLAAFEARHGFVADAFARLDGCRELTRRAILALETAVGPLPREAYPALSTPKSTKERVRIGIDLGDLARRIGGDLREPGLRKRLDAPHAKRWDELRASLEDTRPLGIDIVPEPIGATDETFQAALVAAPPRRRIDALEEARWSAIRRVLALAQNQPFGAARAGVVSSVSLVIERIVASKGRWGARRNTTAISVTRRPRRFPVRR